MEKLLSLKRINQVAMAVFVAAVLSGLSTNVVTAESNPPPFKESHLEYYAQLDVRLPGISTAFLPPINTTLSANFGAGTLFASNITEGVAATSKLLGSVRGYTVETSYLGSPDSWLLEVAFVEYDDGYYNGTLQLQGLVQQSLTELAITGGSGSFRGAKGYLVVTLVVDSLPTRTFRHDLTFL
ncbi:hypothetical protein KP509_20G027200 [Ceratopteris richardii]|uniref:Dirigent protein n=1 Tax=Ceratopteris richardii TaxID=49495 RepID=A0A8T2SG36_CERRI|nr:hypothetical protein KP509_20G027200 [Ceratopteris richardii]